MAAGTALSLAAKFVCPTESSGLLDRYETAHWKAVCPPGGSPTHAEGWIAYSSILESTPSADGQIDPAGLEGIGPAEAGAPPACCTGNPWHASGPRAHAS